MRERLTGVRYEPSLATDMKFNFSWRITEQVQLGTPLGNVGYYVSYMPLSHQPLVFNAETLYSGISSSCPNIPLISAAPVSAL